MALDFIAGCFGGCAGVLVGHPFDTVKVHLQTQNPQKPVYRGTIHCIQSIVAKDSIRGLYKGITSPIGGIALVNAIIFGVYGNVQRNTADPDSIRSHFLAGSMAGLAQSVICSPMELIKTRLQLQSSTQKIQFKNPLQCLGHIWRTERLRGVFRGFGITAMRDIPGFASYFVSFEMMMKATNDPGTLYTLTAGGLAGVISWVITVPMDVVKSRLQADGLIAERQYLGAVDCIRKSYQKERFSFLTRGLACTLLRAFPMNAACFMVVTWILKHFGERSVDVGQNESIPIVLASNSVIGSDLTYIQCLAFNDTIDSNELTVYGDVSNEIRYFVADLDKLPVSTTLPESSYEDFICLGD